MSTSKSDHTEEKNTCARLQYLLPDDLDVGTPYGNSERLKSEHPPIFLCGLQVAEIKSAGRRFSPNLTSCTLAYIYSDPRVPFNTRRISKWYTSVI